MTIRTPSYLKSRFENGDIPQQTDYEDIFDSYLSLATSGAQTIDGVLTVNGLVSPTGSFSGIVSAGTIDADTFILDAEYSIDAKGTTQASARVLGSSISWVASANGNNFGVILSSAQPGRTRYILNTTGNTALRVFPCVGGSFIGTAANASRSIPLNGTGIVIDGLLNTYGLIVVGS